jgi:subtilisin family serine protease
VIEAINFVATNGRKGKGTIILFAMNNFDNNDCAGEKPDISSLENVVAISGSTDTDLKSDSTGWGPCMEFIAPTWMYQHRNGGIVTTDMTGDAGLNPKKIPNELSDKSYTLGFSGTSAATPIVAGVFGLVLSLNDKLSSKEAINILKISAEKVHPSKARYDPRTGFSLRYGYGRVDASKALAFTNKSLK